MDKFNRCDSKKENSEKCDCDLAGGMCKARKKEVPSVKKTPPTNIMVMRHSERVDELFNDWIAKSTKDGCYKAYDINMPRFLPIDRPVSTYERDCPLTITGIVLAQMTGKGLRVAGLKPDVIYCSPATRCLQTATAVRQMSGSNAIIRVEPGFYEDTAQYTANPPVFPTKEQRREFPVDSDYKPVMTIEELNKLISSGNETIELYNKRIESMLQIIEKREEIVKNDAPLKVLIVAHATSVDMAIGLLRSPIRYIQKNEFKDIGRKKYPFCSIAVLEKTEDGLSWQHNPFCVPPITYHNFSTRKMNDFMYRMGTLK